MQKLGPDPSCPRTTHSSCEWARKWWPAIPSPAKCMMGMC